MAEREHRLPDNAPGRWYVDDNCTGCNLCADLHPELFAMNDAKGTAFVRRQPQGDAEVAGARDAAGQCPVEAIGDDG